MPVKFTPPELSEYYHHHEVIAADDAFCAAMRAANKAALEHVTEGIFTDPTPLLPTCFPRINYNHLLTGSPGESCMNDPGAKHVPGL
jgi:hypothetical protein